MLASIWYLFSSTALGWALSSEALRISRTNWDEMPRLRDEAERGAIQLALLLLSSLIALAHAALGLASLKRGHALLPIEVMEWGWVIVLSFWLIVGEIDSEIGVIVPLLGLVWAIPAMATAYTTLIWNRSR